MDIIVTTPKSQIRTAAQEAADAIEAGVGQYFRRFNRPVNISPGDRVFYVEDGYIRGFALVMDTTHETDGMNCDTSGRVWPPGFFVIMDAKTWKWITPIPMQGFQGFRYARGGLNGPDTIQIPANPKMFARVEVVGNWLDPKPATTTTAIFHKAVTP